MATINGVIRSYGAAVRRIEREQQREAREAAKRFREQQKLQEIGDAQQAVLDWENYVEAIQSIHKHCTPPINWNQIRSTKRPTEPSRDYKNERIAKQRLEDFKPSFWANFLRLTKKKIKQLSQELEESRSKDTIEFDNRKKEYIDELTNWKELQEISAGIEKKKPESFREALEYFDPFSDILELGTHVSLSFDENHLDIDLHVNSSDVIPDYELRQTSTGKISKKSMVKSRFNELYQDHVCSASIRIAREVFAYLPIKYVRINSMAKIVNTKTGHLEEQAILSVIFTAQTIESLNLKTIDPSDSMQNFVHNMKFSKLKGFSIIDKVKLSE